VRRLAIRVAAGIFSGFALLAAVDAVAIAVAVPLPSAGLALRLAHHVFDAAETLGLGALFAVAVGAFLWLGSRLPRWALGGVAFVAGVAVAKRVMGAYLIVIAAHVLDGRFPTAVFVFWLALVGAGLAEAPFLAQSVARFSLLRFAPLPLAVAAMAANQIFLRDDYVDVHGILGLGAALVGGGALAPRVERAGRRLARSRAGLFALVALGLFALFGVAVPPSNATRFELFRQPCAIAPWVLATAVWHAPSVHAPVTLPASPWREDRAGAPAVPPTSPPLQASDAVVVLITVDAIRAEVLADPTKLAHLPTLAKLKRDGVDFTRAYAPGAQTETSLASLFSGLYYSEQRWATSGEGWIRQPHPAEDRSPRFPELLTAGGVATAHYAGTRFLLGEFGVARGFGEEAFLGRGKTYSLAIRLIDALLDRLRHPGDRPLFLYTHLIEPHAPYTEGRPTDPPYARYLSSIAAADKQLGRVLSLLEQSFGDRWVLFVSADHGEAFGEHQTTDHAKTLYEELLHVPLLAASPRFSARAIDVPVSLVDLGPTILDLFRVDTPATFEGQSLVPFLAGGTAALTRPLLAEGRLRRALVEPDGLKVIDDPRRKVVEVYDLSADPGETRNVFDLEPARADRALAELRRFFAVHALHEDGYEPQYKP
jgi:arylsulfatase A-like enzyme